MRALVFSLVLWSLATPAFAAEDGTRGQTSTGSLTITALALGDGGSAVRLNGLVDLDFGIITPGDTLGALARSASFCFCHSSPTFALTLQGAEPDVWPLRLQSTAGGSWRSGSLESPKMAVEFSSNALVGLFSNQVSETCDEGPRNQVFFELADPPVDTPAGAHAGLITLIMALE